MDFIADLASCGDQNKAVALSVSAVTEKGQRRLFSTARAERGLKRPMWVQALHDDLVDDFTWLGKLGMKSSTDNPSLLAKDPLATLKCSNITRRCEMGEMTC